VTDRSKTVVLLIDWDNLQICHSRDAPGTELDLNAVTALAQSYGTLVSARAYAEWNLPSERLAVYKAGIEPVFAPVMRPESGTREGKSLADTVMVADGVDLLWTVAPDVFVLVTSDKDMIPLARIAKQRGAAVVVLGSDLTAIPLVELSNVFITYRQLLRELDKTTDLPAPSGRSPARERRVVHESRRPTSEPFGGRAVTGPTTRPPLRPAIAPTPASAQLTSPATSPAEAVPAEPLAAIPTPGPMPAGDGADVDGQVSAEGIARRRRRRGGRSRGRGAGSEAPLQETGTGMQETGTVGDEVVAVEPEEEHGGEGARPAELTESVVEPAVAIEPAAEAAEERPRPRTPARRSTSRRTPTPISSAPLVFSEFGPASSPAASRPESSQDEPPPGGAESPGGPAEGLAPVGEAPGATPTTVEPASPAPADVGQPELTEPQEPLPVATSEPPAGDGVEERSGQPSDAEEAPKPVRRRRTRAAR
jgi:uncharacterized LabA/DUF88 family protein